MVGPVEDSSRHQPLQVNTWQMRTYTGYAQADNVDFQQTQAAASIRMYEMGNAGAAEGREGSGDASLEWLCIMLAKRDCRE